MNLLSLLNYGKNKLKEANCENSSFDAMCLLEHATGFSKTKIILNDNPELKKEAESVYKKLVFRRAEGEPLQYILGKWEFMGLEFNVGPGVLIPRRETEALVEIAVVEINKRREAVVFDLCAGTGCVGISVASICPNSKVYLVENSDDAVEYLYMNLDERKISNVTVIKGDVFKGFQAFNLPFPDIILSNPPYVPTGELYGLQKEVLFEPIQALDGGADGLDFYRAMNELWLPYLSPEGMMAVECGENQADIMAHLITSKYSSLNFFLDLNKIKRIVVIRK
jgi:release factor glutamine methyltransferase